MFQTNDKVVPKAPHGWYDICCQVIRVRNETMCLVSNGQGGKMWLHESQLDYICDVVNCYAFQKMLAQHNETKSMTEDECFEEEYDEEGCDEEAMPACAFCDHDYLSTCCYNCPGREDDMPDTPAPCMCEGLSKEQQEKLTPPTSFLADAERIKRCTPKVAQNNSYGNSSTNKTNQTVKP